jgi:hypothetical protein
MSDVPIMFLIRPAPDTVNKNMPRGRSDQRLRLVTEVRQKARFSAIEIVAQEEVRQARTVIRDAEPKQERSKP